jgi:hypothetical protein
MNSSYIAALQFTITRRSFFGLSKMMFSSFNVMPKLTELSVHGSVPDCWTEKKIGSVGLKA